MITLSIIIMLALIAATLYVGYLILVGIAYLIAFIVAAVQVRTGRITREQLAENAAKYHEQKKQEKERKRLIKWWRDFTRPSTMDIVLGRSSRPTHLDINIDIEKDNCSKEQPYRSTIPCMDHNITY